MLEYLNTGDVAKILGRSRETVNVWIKKGVLVPDAKVGKESLFLASTLNSFLARISKPKESVK